MPARPAYVIEPRIHIKTPVGWRYLDACRPLPQPPELPEAQAPGLGNRALPGGPPCTPFVSELSTSTVINQPPSPPPQTTLHQSTPTTILSPPARRSLKVSAATSTDSRAPPAYRPRHSRRPVCCGQHRLLTGFYPPLHGRRKTLGAGASCSTGARHIACVVARLGVQG